MTEYVQVCSEFLGRCYDLVSDYSSTISSAGTIGLSLYNSYTYDFKKLLEELDNASFLMSQFNNLIIKLQTLQDEYGLSICSLDKAEIFSNQMYQFLKNTGKDTNTLITKVNERAYAKWYRDELKYYIDYLNSFIQFLIYDIQYLNNELDKGNVMEVRDSLKCQRMFFQ